MHNPPAMWAVPQIGEAGWPGRRAAYLSGVKDCLAGYLVPFRKWANGDMQHEYEAGFYNQLWEQSD